MTLTVCAFTQTVIHLDTIGQKIYASTNLVRALAGDSLSSSFCIVIPNEVKAHKHIWHSEQVYVLQGVGEMRLGDKQFKIQAGDLIFNSKNTVHAVKSTGNVYLKVISIQSPRFDGSDRVMVNE